MNILFLIYNLSWIIWILFESWVFIRERKNVDKSEDKSTRGINVISIILAIIIGNLFIKVKYLSISGSFHSHLILAIIIIWAGLCLRFWSVQTLGKFFRTTVMIQKGHRVVKNGPYRYIRHPSYTGLLLTTIGVAIGMENWIGLILMVLIVFISLKKRINLEEEVLQKSLGEEYTSYIKNTKKLIPFIY
jgi:protein-S-isoprenylcysteine O-methyltransferase Ste14